METPQLIQDTIKDIQTGDIVKKIKDGDIFILTREEMITILPWLRESLTAKQKRDENAEVCQLLGKIATLSSLACTAPSGSLTTSASATADTPRGPLRRPLGHQPTNHQKDGNGTRHLHLPGVHAHHGRSDPHHRRRAPLAARLPTGSTTPGSSRPRASCSLPTSPRTPTSSATGAS